MGCEIRIDRLTCLVVIVRVRGVPSGETSGQLNSPASAPHRLIEALWQLQQLTGSPSPDKLS